MSRYFILAAACVGLACIGLATGQPNAPASTANATVETDAFHRWVAAARAELKDGKVGLYNQTMQLSDKEAATFWPIYRDYEEELFAHGDKRIAMIEKFVQAIKAKSLDDSAAKKLSNDYFKLMRSRLDLIEKYHDRIAKELSSARAAQFIQIEHRTNLMIDILVASKLPLIGEEEADEIRLPTLDE